MTRMMSSNRDRFYSAKELYRQVADMLSYTMELRRWHVRTFTSKSAGRAAQYLLVQSISIHLYLIVRVDQDCTTYGRGGVGQYGVRYGSSFLDI